MTTAPTWNPGSGRVFVLTLTGLLTALALGTGLAGRDDPHLEATAGAMTDAVVVAHDNNDAVLKVSDPVNDVRCRVTGTEFAGDLPEVGAVIPVIPAGVGSCDLPVLVGALPRTSLVVTGLVGAAGLLVYGGRRWYVARRRRAQEATLVAYLSRNVAR
ncbi:hypothetical protein [Winogradskya humida]|uniref:Secreted protein with PEP-CTERM sorting signal n=1 Tax=Winogradskya humida TaxID=113566 RepID=A0ABQ3ZK08_9ACTN|nr:hypothetical protein [Actinoplanes humidus]GIE18887.1 hypothetical protein Ahu01nite_019890 [Actinoplanes humidus]